jgi:hypothetical protein
MNKPTPMFKPLCTANVWFPKYVPSDITSLNHKLIQNIKLINAIINIFIPLVKLWKDNTALNVTANKLKLVFKGQGLGETKWKGWAWKVLRVKLVNILFCILSRTVN